MVLFLLSFDMKAQGHKNQLKGSFVLGSAANTPVEFTLLWTEENGRISGEYKDNNFSQYARVSGTSDNTGRQFKAVLPEKNKGVATISIVTSNVRENDTGIQVPVVIVFRDVNGNPIATRSTKAFYILKTSRPVEKVVAQKENEEERPSRKCEDTMGELAGFCGTYRGLFTEEADATNSCNLLLADEISLGLDSERNLRLYLSSPDPLLNPPTHILRQLPPSPRRRIDVTVRSCGTLPAVAFASNPQSCKRLNLAGTFSQAINRKRFIGIYTIFDERSRRFCRYGMSLDQ